MRVISIKNLVDFSEKYPDAVEPLRAWLDEVKKAKWETAHDIKQQFGKASILKNRRVVFNIKGNDYRLIVAVAFKFGAIYIKFIGTHKQYDEVDAETVEMG